MLSSLTLRRTVVLLVLTGVLVITLDRNDNPVIDRIGRGFGVVTSPFERGAEAIADPVVNAWHGVVDYDDVKRENEALRDELERQRGAEIEFRAGILEQLALLDLNDIDSAGRYKSVTARVVGSAPTNFRNTIEIDQGSQQGISEGMPVVGGAGLVGKVTQVFPDRSIVLLITDPSYYMTAAVFTGEIPDDPLDPTASTPDSTTVSGIPESELNTTTSSSTTSTVAPPSDTVVGTTTSTDPAAPDTPTTSTTPPTTTRPPIEVIRETGGIAGQGTGRPLLLRLIDDSVAFNELGPGSIVKTAGGSDDLAPAGLVIGEVSRVSTQPGNRAPLVEVTPYSDLDTLIFVAVILYLPNPGAG
jgi:rod shape-determining protein MreC